MHAGLCCKGLDQQQGQSAGSHVISHGIPIVVVQVMHLG
jgi:glycerol dehydrogenase-like iron-containing ADH family enzyme